MFARILLAGVLVIGLVSVASAQRGGGGPQGNRVDDGSQPGYNTGIVPQSAGRGYVPTRLERITEMLRLNKEQEGGAKKIFDSAQKEASPLRDQIQKSRSAIAVAIMKKEPQADIDQLVTNYGNLMAQMTAVELKAFGGLVESLSPDQQKRVGPVFQQMAGMFSNRDWNRVGN
jgi:hypothetical protein